MEQRSLYESKGRYQEEIRMEENNRNENIKVLLVDDEKLERVLIKQGFPWEEKGFEIIGEANSGMDALEFIRHRNPQVVLTDINMPQMDGLELAEQISKEYPNCYIVIITGFREFDYARRAVKIGVEDFLLKPVNMNDIDKVTQKIKAKLDVRRKQQHEAKRLQERLVADYDILMESFFQRLVERRVNEEQAVAKLALYGYEKLLEDSCCILVGVKGEFQNHKGMLNTIMDLKIKESVAFLHYMQHIIVFLMDGEAARGYELGQQILQALLLQEIEATIGVSEVNHGFRGISNAYEEAKKALSTSVLLGQNQVITYEAYVETVDKKRPMPVFMWEEFLFAVENLLYDKKDELLAHYFQLVRESKGVDVEDLRLMTMDMLSKVGATLNKYGINIFQLVGEDALFEGIRNIDTIEQSEVLVRDSIDKAIAYHAKKKTKQTNRVVQQALEYVNENYCNPELSLRLVAEVVYSNESYLSRAFKKEVGQSLIEYVTRLRIEESIRLLNHSDLKVYEIAEKVGFRDPHYFSICFKKQVGSTIKEFRNRR